MNIRNCSLFYQLFRTSGALKHDCLFHTSSILPGNRTKVAIRKIKVSKKFIVWRGIKVKELAKAMNKSIDDTLEVVSDVMKSNDLKPSTEIHSLSILSAVAQICGGKIQEKIINITEPVKDKDRDVYRRNIFSNIERLKPRPPVVTIMGHVDHGKTTLLDSLRSSRIVDSEFGGITQHIGAFKVHLSDVSQNEDKSSNNFVTFLDTPGHAAFSAMRSRGANCTDIVVLVVAIEDGIMPQTIESIRFAKEANVPIIVAVNKIDRICNRIEDLKKESLMPLYQSLSNYDLMVEYFGGDVQVVPISAQKKWNLDLLQESILTLAEILSIKADYEGNCESVILEANVENHLGKIATVLVQQGSLKLGMVFVAGNTYIKVRTIVSDKGEIINEAKPGDPVQVSGWKNTLPISGDIMIQVESESKAKTVLHYRKEKLDKILAEKSYQEYEDFMTAYRLSYSAYIHDGCEKGYRILKDRPNLEDFIPNKTMINGREIPTINLVIKTDVHGSLEAIKSVLETAAESCDQQCLIKIVHIGVGELHESDIENALATNAIIYLFNLPQSNLRSDVDIRHFNVIYHMFDDLKEYITSKLPMVIEEEVVGEAEIIKFFEVTENKKKVQVIGCRCISGTLYKSSLYYYRIVKPELRHESLSNSIFYNNLQCKNLRHLKTDVETIRKGVECGISLLLGKNDFYLSRAGDILQCYRQASVRQTFSWHLGFQ